MGFFFSPNIERFSGGDKREESSITIISSIPGVNIPQKSSGRISPVTEQILEACILHESPCPSFVGITDVCIIAVHSSAAGQPWNWRWVPMNTWGKVLGRSLGL